MGIPGVEITGGSWTVGVDCGEQRHRLVMLDERGERRGDCWVRNRLDHIEDAVAKLILGLPEGMTLRVVTEARRSIGGVLAQVAAKLGLELWQVNTKALNHYRDVEGQPRKDDDPDAYLMARMCFMGANGCRLAMDPTPAERVLCRLSRLHETLTTQRIAIGHRYRSRLLELAPEVLDGDWEGPAYSGKGMRAVLDRWPCFVGLEKAQVRTVEALLRSKTRYGSRCSVMAKALREMAKRIALDDEERAVIGLELGGLLAQLRLLDAQLAEVFQQIEEKVRQHPIGLKLMAMPGEGPLSAAADVGEVLPLARNVSEGRAATYAGITPLSRLSCGKGRSKLARGVNKHAARANFLSAQASINTSALDRAYYEKQRELHQGHPKPHVTSIISLARQRFKVKYKLMTSEAKYDKETLIKRHLKREKQQKKAAAVSRSAA